MCARSHPRPLSGSQCTSRAALEDRTRDLYAQYLALGLVASFLLTVIVSAILIYADLKNGARTETLGPPSSYSEPAGTNIGDFITHNLHVNYALASLVFRRRYDRRRQNGNTACARRGISDDRPPLLGCNVYRRRLRHYFRRSRRSCDYFLRCSLYARRSPRRWSYLPGGASLRLQLSATWANVLVERAAGTPLGDWLDRGTALGSVCRLRARSLPRFFLRHWRQSENLRAHDKQHQRNT